MLHSRYAYGIYGTVRHKMVAQLHVQAAPIVPLCYVAVQYLRLSQMLALRRLPDDRPARIRNSPLRMLETNHEGLQEHGDPIQLGSQLLPNYTPRFALTA